MNETIKNTIQMQAGGEIASHEFPASSVIYIHYGADRFDPEHLKTDVEKEYPGGLFKPRGLWASRFLADFGWKDWCESEEFNLDRFDKHFGFRLSSNARILEIHKDDDILPYVVKNLWMCDGLNREKLEANFDGMELFYSENYGNLRYGHFYTWDCDSICIWNPDVIVPVDDVTDEIYEEMLRRCPA